MNSDNLSADPADTTTAPAAVPPPAPDDPAAGLTGEQQMALDVMPRELQGAALELRRHAREGELALMRERYAMGRKYLQIKGQPEVYGALGDIQLAAFFGADVALLRQATRLARRYTPEQFERVLAARNPQTGFQVTLDHLVALQRVEDDARADEALALALTDGWTPTQLARAITKKLRAAAGPPKAPRSKPARLPGYLDNFAAVTGEWGRQFDEVWEAGFAITDAYNAMPPEKIDRGLAERLQECRDLAESAAAAQHSLAREFERLRAKAEETVRSRQGGG